MGICQCHCQQKKIVPIFWNTEGKTETVKSDDVIASAKKVLALEYNDEDISIMTKYLLSQNGIYIRQLNKENITANKDRLCGLVYDTFCSGESNIGFYKDYLSNRSAGLNKINIFGDYDSNGLTLDNSYVPISFLRHPTVSEKDAKKDKHDSLEPTDSDEKELLSDLERERLAVIVGDAGQGKSSFVRHLAASLSARSQEYGLSRDMFFPLYLECKNIKRDHLSNNDDFLNAVSGAVSLSRPALDALMRYGKPLFILDAMDEIPPAQMDSLIDAVYNSIYLKCDRSYFIFTSRPGQKLVAGNGDMTLSNESSTTVRRYSVKEFNETQRNTYIENLAKAKRVTGETKDSFMRELTEKEEKIQNYYSVSRNPFMLFAIFSTYSKDIRTELPENRFDAVCRIIDDIIDRDLNKKGNKYSFLGKKNVCEILGAVSLSLYKQRDKGKISGSERYTPCDYAEEIYNLNHADKDDRLFMKECGEFFDNSKLFDENGFGHEFLASTYAAYYLLFLMKREVKKEKSPIEIEEISLLKKDAYYWKSVAEDLLCLIDRKTDDSKIYVEPLLDKLQNTDDPDYDTLCSAVSQFVNHQPRGAAVILSGMLERGCKGIIYGKQMEQGFICEKGINPYEELFYFPALYPSIQQYLPNLTARTKQGEEHYLCSELIKEVCALFSDDSEKELTEVYNNRTNREYPEINEKLSDAAYRINNKADCGYITNYLRGELRGYVRLKATETTDNQIGFVGSEGLSGVYIPDGAVQINSYIFAGCDNLLNVILPDSLTEINYFSFTGCTNLSSINIPDSVRFIAQGAFLKCPNLKNVNIGKNNHFFSSDNGVIFNKDRTSLLFCPNDKTGTYSIPDSVVLVGDYAFSGCSKLTDIIIPDSVKIIGNFSFCSCTNLSDMTIPDSVTTIGDCAFRECTNMTKITIPESVTPICREDAFEGCPDLSCVYIEEPLIPIGVDAFEDCTHLKIYCKKGSYAEKYAEENKIPFTAE